MLNLGWGGRLFQIPKAIIQGGGSKLREDAEMRKYGNAPLG